MTLPTESTTVTYPTGTMMATGTVIHVEQEMRREGIDSPVQVVILDVTPCHPVDAGWPDQPSDRALLEWNGGEAKVIDCVVGATDGEKLYLGADVPVRKGTEGWVFVVAHLVTTAPPEGIVVTVRVDEKYRKGLSIGHTACHLASLALNAALAGRWSKEISVDGVGSPNFDDQANDSSRIREQGSVDTYRLGKSLRKKGFSTEGFAEDLPTIEATVNESLTAWIAQKAAVRIEREGDLLTDRRYWVCELDEGEARIPCGGTHASTLGDLKGIRASLSLKEVEGTLVLTMETSVA
ncbi:MAG: metal-dependent hydrolase [Terrimesophilobacter sp.]